MWIGHVAPAFLLRPFLPRLPLSVLFFACASADFVAFLFSLVGIEIFRFNPVKHGALPYDFLMPYTHSLAGMAAWGVLYAAVTAMLVRSNVLQSGDQAARSKVVSAAQRAQPAASFMSLFLPTLLLVVSHWVLEVPVHRTLKDGVPLVPHGDTKFGWGLFNQQMLSNALELSLFLPAFAFYLSRTQPVPFGVPTMTPPWYARPATFGLFCTVSQLMVCAAPHWFYKMTPDSVMLMNGLMLMAAESAMVHAVDTRRMLKIAK